MGNRVVYILVLSRGEERCGYPDQVTLPSSPARSGPGEGKGYPDQVTPRPLSLDRSGPVR